jgi:hypothetical protein
VRSAETALELAARQLLGEVLARVDYLDAWPGRERGAVGDCEAVGLAVYLTMASGRCVEVRWADTFGMHHGFGIDVREVRVRDGDRGKLVDATARWADRIGRRIERAAIEWGDARADLRDGFAIGIAIHADHLRRPDYPRALAIELDDARTVAIETRFENALTVRLG